MARKISILILIICAHLSTVDLSLFRRRSFSMEKWPDLIYKEIAYAVNSKLECTALCRVEANTCFGVIWNDSTCYLGDPKGQFSVVSLPQIQDQDMLIDQGKMMISMLIKSNQ